MTIEELDIAQLFNIPCKITVRGTEYKNPHRIAYLLRFWNSELKCWTFSVMMEDIHNPKLQITAALNEIQPIAGGELFIAEKLKQLKDKKVYETVKDKLMCREGIG